MSVNLSLFAGAGAQFFDDNGVPLAGGLIYTYAAGSTSPLATYTSSSGVTPLPNPIVLNAAGRIPTGEIWVTAGVIYKFVVYTSTNVLVASYDNINGTYIATDLADTNNPAKGDALVGFRQSNSSGNLVGAVGRTVHQKFQEYVSVKDFGATGDGVTDDSAAIQAAINSSLAVYFPSGDYYVASTINLPNAERNFFGDGKTSRIFGSVSPLIAYSTLATSTSQNFYNMMFEATGDNIAVKMYRTWGASFSISATISNCYFYNSSATTTTAVCLAIQGVNGAVISNNIFYGRGPGGSPTTNIGGYGIKCDYTESTSSNVMNLNISNNVFSLMGYPYWSGDRVTNAGGHPEGHSIVGNEFVAGNIAIRSATSLALTLSSNLITDYYVAVELTGDYQFNIANNNLDGSYIGISLNATSVFSLQLGIINGNYILIPSSPATQAYGIRLNNALAALSVNNIIITNNFIGRLSAAYNPLTTGIQLTGAFTIVGISINNNEFCRLENGIDFNNSTSVSTVNMNGNFFYVLLNAINYTGTTAINGNINASNNIFFTVTNKVVNPTLSRTLIPKTYDTTNVFTIASGGTSQTLTVPIDAGIFAGSPDTAFAMSDGAGELVNAYYQKYSGVATFVGGITGTTLTVSSVTSGTIAIGQLVYSGALPYTYIVSGSGTTWTVSLSQTVAAGTTLKSAGSNVNATFNIQRNDAGAFVGGSERFYATMTGQGYYVG